MKKLLLIALTVLFFSTKAIVCYAADITEAKSKEEVKSGKVVTLVENKLTESEEGDYDYRKLYHKPQTEAEKKLDEILNLAMKGHAWEMYTYPISSYKEGITIITKKEYKHYASLLTTELAQMIKDEDLKIAKEECPTGTEDGYCGFDFDPIICGHDFPDSYLYYTLKQTENEAIIDRVHGDDDPKAYPKDYKPSPRHRLLKQNGKWKLDGICKWRLDGIL